MKKKDYEITVKRVSVVGFNVEAENIQKARELAENDAKNHNWSSEDAEYVIGSDDAPEFIRKIDWSDLRGQKTVLIKLADTIRDTPPQPYKKDGVEMTIIMMPKDTEDVLEGILGIIDAVQDYAVDVLGIPEIHVFDFEEEENREKSTPEENFARESAARIFDELCESDGFHQNEEMSVDFIASIMADKMHADIIRAKIRNQILNDLKAHPQLFDISETTRELQYDGDMREDYEGLVTRYIRDQFDSGRTVKLWLCPHCGSDNVEIKKWVNANSDNVGTDCEEDEGYCNDCEQRGELLLSDVKANAKIVGFQVIDDERGEMHPTMEASFCLYNLSQAKEMLNGSPTMNFAGNWKLLAIWTGDIEEPTRMFKGNPRD
jgi:hypothetical protein